MTNEEMIEKVVDADSRSKSAIKICEENKADIKELRDENKAIYELTYSVKSIAENMCSMKDDIAEVKQNQISLTDKVGMIEKNKDKEDADKWRKSKSTILDTVIKVIVTALISGFITVIATLIATGTISA